MREIEAIIAAFTKAQKNELECVLATVVHVEGSSYRKAGARMLIDENGMMTGAISGGCLEGDAMRKALHSLHQGKNKLITYDTSDEEDAIIGAQLGCNGIIQVLFEPIDQENESNPIELLRKVVAHKQPLVIVTLFNLDKSLEQTGTSMVIDQQLKSIFYNETEKYIDPIKRDARLIFEQQHNYFSIYKNDGKDIYAFLEYYLPPVKLVLIGAGNDAQVLASMADVLGWEIAVVDGRPTHANTTRFVSACQVVVSKPETLLENISIDERTVFVLISHNYNYDLAVLKILLQYPEIPYIGILGPKKKYQRMFIDLNAEGISLSAGQEEKIFAPIGLHLGAETPAEIALSVLAEIQMVLTGANGASLRTRKGSIHKKKFDDFKVSTIE